MFQHTAKIEENAKRPLEDVDGNPAKRANNGIAISSIAHITGMDPVITENWTVPDMMVGLIIGRGGEQITALQAETQCRVQMAPESGGMPDRPVTLTGTKGSIERAKIKIQEIMAKANGRPPPNSTKGGLGGGFVMEMSVPGTKVGLVIGKNGETLKSIQERAGVRMTVVQEDNQSTQFEKPLRIIGEQAKCEYAKQLVDELLASRDDNPPGFKNRSDRQGGFTDFGGGQKSLGEVIVPRIAVGVIIGKGGEMIKKLQSDSGARVQFKLGEDETAPERTALVTGTPEQIQRATQIITELVNTAVTGGIGGGGGGRSRPMSVGGGVGGGSMSGATQAFYMHVPANKTGLIIGKGGETIKQINQESGAYVELSRDPPPNDFEKVFVIKGTAQAIHHAQHLVRIKVGDIPPGTPIPPMTNSYGATQQANPNPYQPGFNQYPGAVNDASDPNAAAWAAYYAQMYNQPAAQNNYPYGGPQPGAAQAAVAPQPQPIQQVASGGNSAPTINPQTGQPDYSAQWAEYYRSLGMHDQAALIEQQAKANQQAAHSVAPQQQPYNPYGAQGQPAQAPAAPGYSYPAGQQQYPYPQHSGY